MHISLIITLLLISFHISVQAISPSDIIQKHFINDEKIATSALMLGYTNIFEDMLRENLFDPSYDDNFAIRFASMYGYTETVKILLSDYRVDPSSRNNEAISKAIIGSYYEIVKLLLRDFRVDPTLDNYKCIREAAINYNKRIFNMIIGNKKVNLRELLTLSIKTENPFLVMALLKSGRVKFNGVKGRRIIICSEHERSEISRIIMHYDV